MWVEPLFGAGQQWHGVRRFRLRTLVKVHCEGVLTATGQHLKRLPAWRGWGRRHFPGAAHGVVLPLNNPCFAHKHAVREAMKGVREHTREHDRLDPMEEGCNKLKASICSSWHFFNG